MARDGAATTGTARHGVSHPGGLRVLLKPNLLADCAPDQAVTTHPEVARAVIRLARECGAIPAVADSPSGALRLQAVLEKTGFKALCDQERIQFINLERAGSASFACGTASLELGLAGS